MYICESWYWTEIEYDVLMLKLRTIAASVRNKAHTVADSTFGQQSPARTPRLKSTRHQTKNHT